MEENLAKVKFVFDKIKDMRLEIGGLFDILDGRITKLEEIYDGFIKNTKMFKSGDIKVFIFSLDSFYFQNSLIKREYRYLRNYYNIIVNRMYGEYYKLFKLINEYVERSLVDNKLSEILRHKKYPRYDDLDDEKEYDFKLITQLNEDIISVINYLINILRNKENSLKLYMDNQNYGLNVNNFVSTFNYEVVVLQEQISLYEKYLDFFYHVHEKLLKRLITKISVLDAQLNTDVKFEGGLISTKKDSKVLFDEINMDGLNKKVVKDLRRSITRSNIPAQNEILIDGTDSDEVSDCTNECIPNISCNLIENTSDETNKIIENVQDVSSRMSIVETMASTCNNTLLTSTTETTIFSICNPENNTPTLDSVVVPHDTIPCENATTIVSDYSPTCLDKIDDPIEGSSLVCDKGIVTDVLGGLVETMSENKIIDTAHTVLDHMGQSHTEAIQPVLAESTNETLVDNVNKINTDNTETNESSQSTQNNIIVHNKENEIAQVEQTNIKPEVAKPTVPAAKLNGLARSVINLKFGRK